jgi:glycosyltransferase involved in cell wall biosynthesis
MFTQLQTPRILVLCPAKNEENGIRNAIQTILSQDYQNVLVHVVDNNSDDNTFNIVESIALRDSRVSISKTHLDLSINRSWEFALTITLNSFEFDYLMFFGGDDRLVGNSFLSDLMNQIHMKPKLSGVVPLFIDQYGKVIIDLKLQEWGNQNLYLLCKEWAYVHAVYGLYSRQCWDTILTKHLDVFDKGVAFDWWLTANLLRFPVVDVKKSHYLKHNKFASYEDEYYLGNEYKGIQQNRGKIPSVHKLSFILSPVRTLLTLGRNTNLHFRGKNSFLNQISGLTLFKMVGLFFFMPLSKVIKGKFLDLKNRI